jgi:hypothetical protein
MNAVRMGRCESTNGEEGEMRVIKRLVSGRFKAALLALTLCGLVPVLSGCILTGDYIKSGGLTVGEKTTTSGGLLAVMYRDDGGQPSKYFGPSQYMLDTYRNWRARGANIHDSASLVLGEMQHRACDDMSGYYQDRCRDAFDYTGEWHDFYLSLKRIADDPLNNWCLAIQFRSGEDWQTRSYNDNRCHPGP